MHRKRALGSNAWLLAMVFVLGATVAASACSCAPSLDVDQELHRADAVFAGRVVALELVLSSDPAIGVSLEQLRATLSVHSAWKGDVGEQTVVYTVFTCCVCGFRFEIGEEYLVYAIEQDGELHTSICTRTRLLGVASDDLEKLGHLTPAIWAAPENTEPDPASE